jgi:PAS domain S-box-containing protein
MPHGMCYLWQSDVLALHVLSDSLIAVAYFSIPFTLIYLTRKRQDLRVTGILWCFAAFIVSCGSSHLMEIWTIWHPDYWAAGAVKAVTALMSLATAALLIRLVPMAIRIPSPAMLASANAELVCEITERRRDEQVMREINQALEMRIAERTEELTSTYEEFANEIRERKQSDALLSRVLTSITDGVIVTNAAGVVTYMNRAATRLLNCTTERATGSHIAYSLTFVDSVNGAVLDWTQGLPAFDSAPESQECVMRGWDGSETAVAVSAAPLQGDGDSTHGVVFTVRDNTERKRAELIEQRMASIIASAEDAILTKTLEGTIETWNPAAEQLLGYAASDIIGASITCLIPEERLEEETSIIEQIQRGESVASFETVRRRKNGSMVDVSLTISPVKDRTGAVIGASKIMRDITERKVHVEKLRALNEELQTLVVARSAQLAERDSMLQEIHHRVKNNLQVISSLINMQSRAILDGPTKFALQDCQSRVETMAQIREMLYQSSDYGRIPFWQFAKALATRIVSASGIAPQNISISYDLNALSLPVEKAIPCGLILNELISNALRHAFPEGRGAIAIRLLRVSDVDISLEVADDGCGIPAALDLAKTRSLGLQLISTLTGQLEGQLHITRSPGAAFRITFPCEGGVPPDTVIQDT